MFSTSGSFRNNRRVYIPALYYYLMYVIGSVPLIYDVKQNPLHNFAKFINKQVNIEYTLYIFKKALVTRCIDKD